jgi:negative regulator of flagellin synthesis FlgM
MSISNGIANLQGLSNSVTPASAAAPAGKEQQVKTNVATSHTVVKINHPVDQAVISSTSNLITQALGGSDVRLEKIRPLQAAIAEGSYNVSSSDVADSLISSALS